jgi:hypothetical protein
MLPLSPGCSGRLKNSHSIAFSGRACHRSAKAA